jgi:hypothetical protein
MLVHRQLDTTSLITLFSIFLGWFFIDTLAVTLGSLVHGVRFFDLPAVIADPTRMFFAIERTARTYLFGALCLFCLLLPFAVVLRRERWTWFTYCAPLALMLICGALLYARSSGEFLAVPADTASVSSNLIRFANGLVHRGSGVVARHVTVGVGGYLAFAGSVLLAAMGVRGYRKHRSNAA